MTDSLHIEPDVPRFADDTPIPRPHPEARVSTCSIVGPKKTALVWVALSAGGLAVQWDRGRGYEAEESKAKPHQLFVSLQHEATGLRVIGFDASDLLLSATTANVARVTRVRDELLRVRVPEGDATPTTPDGTIDWPRITTESRMSEALLSEINAIRLRHLPGKPAWRASRSRSNGGEFASRWFASEAAARRWLADGPGLGGWRALEHWTSRPPAGSPELANVPDYRALARGEFPSPTLMKFEWRVGRGEQADRVALPGCVKRVKSAPAFATGTDLDAWHERLLNDEPQWQRVPTGELDDVTERLLASGLLRHAPADGDASLAGEDYLLTRAEFAALSRRDYLLTRAGFAALSRRVLEGQPVRGEYGTTRTSVALEGWKRAKREHADRVAECTGPGRARTFGGTHGVERERILAWLRLLRCVARDRVSAIPRAELPEWRCPDAWTEVLALRGEVGEVAVKKPGEQWRWYSFVAAPVVSWAPGCAVKVDPNHEIREHTARDWCERSADELRRLVAGEPEPAPPAPPAVYPHPATRLLMRPRSGSDRSDYLVDATRARAAAVKEMDEATVAAAEVDVLGWDGSADLERDMRGCLERELDAGCLGTLAEVANALDDVTWVRESDRDEVLAAIVRHREASHGRRK